MYKKPNPLTLTLMAIFAFSAFALAMLVAPQNIYADDCIVPESGPWPACATGGDTQPVGSADCVIPTSGPWPPCATGGGQTNPPPIGNSDCVIPPSGPWPPCATGGEANNLPDNNSENPPPPPSTETPPTGTNYVNITDVNRKNSRELQITFDYTYDAPDEGDNYILTGIIFDPDSCLGECSQGLVGDYSINTVFRGDPEENFRRPLPESGTLTVPVAVDNLFCSSGVRPITNRLMIGFFNIRELYLYGTTTIDIVHEFNVYQEWCID